MNTEDKIDKGITTNQFLREFKEMVDDMGGVQTAANKLGLYSQNVYNILAGDRLPGKVILTAMGYEPVKEIKYRYKRVK